MFFWRFFFSTLPVKYCLYWMKFLLIDQKNWFQIYCRIYSHIICWRYLINFNNIYLINYPKIYILIAISVNITCWSEYVYHKWSYNRFTYRYNSFDNKYKILKFRQLSYHHNPISSCAHLKIHTSVLKSIFITSTLCRLRYPNNRINIYHIYKKIDRLVQGNWLVYLPAHLLMNLLMHLLLCKRKLINTNFHGYFYGNFNGVNSIQMYIIETVLPVTKFWRQKRYSCYFAQNLTVLGFWHDYKTIVLFYLTKFVFYVL